MEVKLGYMPFVDSAAVIVAAEKGFAADEGLRLSLVRETSWANIRDRLAVGHFHGAHMPAPLSLAGNLGLYPMSTPVDVVMTLNLGGGAITVSNDLFAALTHAGLSVAHDMAPALAGSALKAVVHQRNSENLPRLRLAIGFDHSSQGYQLRYWLNACGLTPGRDVDVVALPSPLMADALTERAIDGFCAAEPWNSVAIDRGVGQILTTSAAIWREGPDKVLGVSRRLVEDHPNGLDALLRALYRSAQWCGNRDNIEELAGILAAPRYLGVEGRLLLPALTGEVMVAPGVARQIDGFLVLERPTSGFPWQSQALWFYGQMVRAGHTTYADESRRIVLNTYRPDLYRRALKPVFAPMPDQKREGLLPSLSYAGSTSGSVIAGQNGFFDGRIFDPDRMDNDLSH